MTRVFGLLLCGALFVACDKPSEEDCRKAVANMRSIHGTENPTVNADPDVRRCKGASSKKSVQCVIAAKTEADLAACGFKAAPAGSAGSAGSAIGSAAGSGVAP